MRVSMVGQELLIVRILYDNPDGLYSTEIERLSKGVVLGSSLSSLLGRLARKGYIARLDGRVRQSVLLKLTAFGVERLKQWAGLMGVTIVPNAFRRKEVS